MVIHFTPSKPLENKYFTLRNNGDGGGVGGDGGRGDDGGGGLDVESTPGGGR